MFFYWIGLVNYQSTMPLHVCVCMCVYLWIDCVVQALRPTVIFLSLLHKSSHVLLPKQLEQNKSNFVLRLREIIITIHLWAQYTVLLVTLSWSFLVLCSLSFVSVRKLYWYSYILDQTSRLIIDFSHCHLLNFQLKPYCKIWTCQRLFFPSLL